MSKLEILTICNPKSIKLGAMPGGFGAITSADILAACSGSPDYFFKLMRGKYAYAVTDSSRERLADLLSAAKAIGDSIGSGDTEADHQLALDVVIDFIGDRLCHKCKGRGTVKWNNGQVVDCKACDGTGHRTQNKDTSLFSILLSGLAELESEFDRKLREKLRY